MLPFSALLSHQMNQLFKLEHELRLEKIDLDHEKVEVQVTLCSHHLCNTISCRTLRWKSNSEL